MNSTNNNSPDPPSPEQSPAQTLRQRAEEKLRAMRTEEMPALPPADTIRLLHELRVRQIELEMQNEELRRAQHDLEASRARYFDLYDLAPVGYLSLSEHNLILEANLAAAALLGVARDALTRQPLPRFILAEDEDTFYRHRRQLFETDQPQVCELRLRRPDKTTFWARLDAVVARGGDGGARVCRMTMSDITARNLADEKVRQSEERFQLAARATHDAIYDWDLRKNTAWLSDAHHTLFGYKETQADYEWWHSKIHPEDQAKTVASMNAVINSGGECWTCEYRFHRADGTYAHVLDRGCVVRNSGGSPRRLLGAMSDITERKRAEEERERLLNDLRAALDRVKQLTGLLPICGGCKRIRDPEGRWHGLEDYITGHSEAVFSHGLCDECTKKMYPKYAHMLGQPPGQQTTTPGADVPKDAT